MLHQRERHGINPSWNGLAVAGCRWPCLFIGSRHDHCCRVIIGALLRREVLLQPKQASRPDLSGGYIRYWRTALNASGGTGGAAGVCREGTRSATPTYGHRTGNALAPSSGRDLLDQAGLFVKYLRECRRMAGRSSCDEVCVGIRVDSAAGYLRSVCSYYKPLGKAPS